MVNNIPEQGDVIWLNLNPKKGHEQQGKRPYLCLSNKIISDYAGIAIFAPISTTKRSYPVYYDINDLGYTVKGQILLDQIVTVDYNARPFQYEETLSKEDMKLILKQAKMVFDENQ